MKKLKHISNETQQDEAQIGNNLKKEMKHVPEITQQDTNTTIMMTQPVRVMMKKLKLKHIQNETQTGETQLDNKVMKKIKHTTEVTQPDNNITLMMKMKHNIKVTQPTKSDVKMKMKTRSASSANLKPSSASKLATSTLNRAISKRKNKSPVQLTNNSIINYFSSINIDRTDANKGKVED